MNILVTGGLGYIGSHVCVVLLNEGYEVIIADNLYNSKIETLYRIKKISKKEVIFYNIDVTKETELDNVFNRHSIDGIIHLAGFKAVEESFNKPLEYYYNNLVSTMILSKLCKKYRIRKFLFSSSATVYGNNEIPFKEEMELLPINNPYGATKAMSEKILLDMAKANRDFSLTILRYFNPIGAHESGLIGEYASGNTSNLMPHISKVASGEDEKLYIFGGDYSTVDGTGVRDYIHIMDLAEGHLAALKNIKSGVHIYNLGTGKGTSVLELVQAFEKANNIKIPYEIVDRRAGDIVECYADSSKAEREIGWKAKRDIEEMCRDSWRYQKNYYN